MWMDTIPKVLSLCFPHLVVDPNRSDYCLNFPNGSEYWIGGLDTKERVEKILGKEFSTIHFNECSQLDYHAVQIALTRLAEKNELKKKVYYDQNPPKKNHWAYLQFHKKLNPIDNEPLENVDNYGHLLMNPSDNLENIDDEYIAMLESLPEKDRDRFLKGLYGDCDDGTTYYAFDRERHVKDCNKIAGTLMIGMDFNVNPMTAVVGQFYNNKFHVIDEVYLPNSDTQKTCDYLKRKSYLGNIYPDSTGMNRKTSGKSDFKILEDNGFKIETTRNPFVNDRVNNINRLFMEDRIIINKRCKKLINDLERVAWKDGKLDDGPDKQLTHISDALGYWCWKLEPMLIQRKSTYREGGL